MFQTTEAIVLQLLPYKDNNAVVKLFSKSSGILSCWAASIHTKKSKTKANLLQPLSIVKAEINAKGSDSLVQLREIETAIPTPHIMLNIEKSTIAIFLAELLLKAIKESSHDENLYDFTRNSILLLNSTNERCTNFHLLFTIRLSGQLGLLPGGNYSNQTSIFNLQEGVYQSSAPAHPHFMNAEESEWLSKLSSVSMGQFADFSIPAPTRKALLKGLLQYFELHLAMQPLKSHLVLEEVF